VPYSLLDDDVRETSRSQRRRRREAEGDDARGSVCPEATADADLDTLCTVIYCIADYLLPASRANASVDAA